MQRAFSLVEIAIVLVIIGLLVGAIIGGQSLIRAGELRAIPTEHERYSSAVIAFKDKYGAIPGDLHKATSYWGTQAACGGSDANGACNGNANGMINQDINGTVAVSTANEVFQFWRHLALAGLIEGRYTGIAGPTAGNNGLDTLLEGTTANAPKSRLTASGWSVRYIYQYPGDVVTFANDYRNMYNLGAINPGDTLLGAALNPTEAWNVDMKMDDGLPGTGKIVPRSIFSWGHANACTLATSQTDYAAGYNVSSKPAACSLFFPRAF
jgi:prepilin-type N-terminal cleavage/methylation domain-containing protein